MIHTNSSAAGKGASSTLELIRNSRERLRQRIADKIKFADPYVLFHDKGLIYPNTINLIQGKTGSHKSRLVELICVILLARNPELVERISWVRRGSSTQKFRVVYIDTERNERDQLPYALQQIQLKAGYKKNEKPENFDYFSFIQVPRMERHQALEDYLRLELNAKSDEAVVVVLDVITDCVSNFNDSADSMQLLDFLNMQISQHNITFICVIHENPTGGDKPRGHVGTELQNKSSSQLQIGYEQDAGKRDTELIRVSTLKNRVNAKQPPVYLRYDVHERGLVLAEDALIQQTIDSRRTKVPAADLLDFLKENLREPMSSADLIVMIKKHFGCSRGTAFDRIKELLLDGNRQLIAANVTGPRLEKIPHGKKELYHLVFPGVFEE
ncbi:hypothetical protein H8S95_03595 [Pontibacter sp. KCTC 32443]|uniref:hypothetical protein n=1 Tax=Pontibacter TaxID=323449 RepID=UPI00164DEE80|nr:MULTISPECIES: hypothetical protein [Pontibacter]MBC5773136.1 hypothetical protein [Pontibacter sp. KCTC 32443]